MNDNLKGPKVFREGIMYTAKPLGRKVELSQADQLLSQLEEEGIATRTGDEILIRWEDLYNYYKNPSYLEGQDLLGLPKIVDFRPVINNSDSLGDSTFKITLSGFINERGKRILSDYDLNGGILAYDGKNYLLPESCWKTVEEIAKFHNRSSSQRTPIEHQKAWASIRKWALKAKAELSDYLRNTIVLTPDKLKLVLRRQSLGEKNVIEVTPAFEEEPPGWIDTFDKYSKVQERYDIANGSRLIMVYPSPEAIVVLQEIKKMPGRRVAGNRAEAFILNPFSVLGPAAKVVLNPEQFEEAREEAGIWYARFTAKVKDAVGINSISLLIEEAKNGEFFSSEFPFKDVESLEKFVTKLSRALRDGSPMLFWEGFDLELLGETPDQLIILEKALRSWKYKNSGISLSEILDLSRYSGRIDKIGIEKPYYSPFIAKKEDEESWFPENVVFGVHFTPEGETDPITVTLNEERLIELKEKFLEADQNGKKEFIFLGLNRPIKVTEAKEILDTIGTTKKDVKNGDFNQKIKKDQTNIGKRQGLILKSNIETIDYTESRGLLTLSGKSHPKIPTSLNPKFSLKDHQKTGVAWLQHLWKHSPRDCRGAVLADDMGLGKTLQLLCLIVQCFEEEKNLDPVLVVAPVALLDNWKDELEQFFAKGTLQLLRLYGEELNQRRISKSELEQELFEAGITKLLRKNWIGNAQVVLTTYETLRDLEFSLAAQKWSIMICDEAQKIKNPNAMMTRSAKKQNARFKIACTGTPVENSLSDIWCLFDFIQPGLLGALNTFGRTYRRPIEAKSDEEKQKIEELRSIIQPQILRRIKEDVAKDLPRKIQVGFDSHSDQKIQDLANCISLNMSERQKGLYAGAIGHFRNSDEGADRAKNHLGLLQHLRRVCIDPRPFGQVTTNSESVRELEKNSPRLMWLFNALKVIQNRNEKVIIFCEIKEIQRLLQRCIAERFNLIPAIVNGDISVDSKQFNNRKAIIKDFQEKNGFNVILLSPLAAGFGLNIQAANHVIHYSRPWNPAKEDQATDRAYRIGQQKEVFVYCPVVVAKDFITFDKKLDNLLRYKRDLSKDMLNGTGDIPFSDFVDIEGTNGTPIVEDTPLVAHDIEGLNGNALEALCVLLWGRLGFMTYLTPRTGDLGVDVVAIKGKEGFLIQCKSSSIEGKELGWEAIKDVVAGHAAYSAKHPDVGFERIAVTNQFFNKMAQTQAEINKVILVDRSGLEERIGKNKIMWSEIEKILLAV